MHGVQNEHVIGDYLTNCKNSEYCFDSSDLWDCKYVFQAFDKLKDAMDIQECGDGERLYESAFSGYNAYGLLFTIQSLGEPSDLIYSSYCPHSQNLFGCVGVTHRKYCILNKQYSKEDYEVLVPRIIEHMQRTGEWGEFFPISTSPFPYKETLAQYYYPLSEKQVRSKAWHWENREEAESKHLGAELTLPDGIEEVDDSICSKILTCEISKKHYKIIPQELKLHQQMKLPLPRRAFFQRMLDHMQLRNPRVLWNRACMKCSTPIQTTYAPDRPDIVYCEKCYLEAMD